MARRAVAPSYPRSRLLHKTSDIHEKWARLPEPGFHILTRAMADRLIGEGGGKLSSAPLQMTATAKPEVVRGIRDHLQIRLGWI